MKRLWMASMSLAVIALSVDTPSARADTGSASATARWCLIAGKPCFDDNDCCSRTCDSTSPFDPTTYCIE
jgi:hypothetical protein